MVRKVRTCLVAGALAVGAWLTVPRCPAQDLPATSAPAASHPSTPATLSGPPAPCPGGPSVGPPPACAPYEDCNGPTLRGDPLLDRPGYPQPGWFGDIVVGINGPKFTNRLTATVANGAFTDTVQVPTAELHWTGSPHVEFGYRLPEGLGEFLLGYESVVTDGRGVLPGFDPGGGNGLLRSRLNVNVIDVDYGTREFSLGPDWDMKWRVGVEVASVYFDSRAAGAILEQRVSNNFVGAGPHVVLDLWHRLDATDLALFAHVDAAAVIGDVTQHFEETVTAGGTQVGAAAEVTAEQAAPVVMFEAGLGWTPCLSGYRPRFAVGYQIQQWWYIGKAGDSSAKLTVQGVFLRAEWNY